MTGAGISAAGLTAIKWSTVEQVAPFMIISPLIGLTCGFFFMAVILNLTKKAHKSTAETYFKRLQLLSAASLQFQPRHK